jgi:cysteine desulfurase
MDVIYLDYAATTPVNRDVLEAMLPYFTQAFGNPSSIHMKGHEAKIALEDARASIASFIGASPSEIYFTSGGTEANNFIIKGIARANRRKGNHIIISLIEHHSVLDACRSLEEDGYRLTYLVVDKYGMVDPDRLSEAITDETILISLMHANNEVGTIEPIAQIGRVARDKGIPFHTDAVQTFGYIPINVDDFYIDALSASAHKIYGPKGVGMAFIRKSIKTTPSLHGGQQERHYRAGTENVPGIVGFSRAVEITSEVMQKEANAITTLRDRLIEGLVSSIEGACLNGHPKMRLPNNVNISIDGVNGEAMLIALRLEGICASNGSACNSSSTEPSHVLLSMGLCDELVQGALRFTLGRETTDRDIDSVLSVLPRIVNRYRKFH